MKLIPTVFLSLFIFKTSFSQIPDSTLENLFQEYQPDQIRKFTQINRSWYDFSKMEEYRIELSFKIPTLNPISNQKINSQFGYRIHPISKDIKKHEGIDIAGIYGQPVYATADGEIIEVGYNQFLGNYLKIKHILGFESIYGHLTASHVQQNNIVYQGQIIGSCGSTGRTTGVHLHFAIRWKNEFLNPYPYIF